MRRFTSKRCFDRVTGIAVGISLASTVAHGQSLVTRRDFGAAEHSKESESGPVGREPGASVAGPGKGGVHGIVQVDDCNQNGIPDDHDQTVRPFLGLPMPDLVGTYAGIGGWSHDARFDFGRPIWQADHAWLRLKGSSGIPDYYLYTSSIFADFDNSVGGAVDVDGEFEVCMSLVLPPSVLDGSGSIHVWAFPHACCDMTVLVTEATLWLDGDLFPTTADLRGFAIWQRCFSGSDHNAVESCEAFDLTGDGDVDHRDLGLFMDRFAGP